MQEEIDSVIDTGSATVRLEDRARMPYTDAALHEVCVLYRVTKKNGKNFQLT